MNRMTQSDTVLAGLDVGGTKIGICLGTPDGTVLAADRIATDPARAPEDLLSVAFARLDAMRSAADLPAPAAVGAACPGPLSYREQRLLEVPNMPRWQGFPIGTWLAERCDVPTAFMNDANASVLAEVLWGAARGADTAVFLTMSTGMGAGLWLNGRVFEGPLALAGEIGHLRLTDDGPVGFGKRGSVEGYLSGPGMAQVAAAEVLAHRQRGAATVLADVADLTPERICAAARDGDPAARAVVGRCGAHLGRLGAVLVDLLNPDVLVLGTIGAAWPDLWIPPLERGIRAEALPAAAAHVRIAASTLPDRGNQTALAVAAQRLAREAG